MKITIQAGTSTYLVADKTVAVDGVGCHEGRLKNQPALVRALSRVGSAPITLPLNIRNDDGFIPDSVDLWAASVAIVTDAGYEWHGKITAYDSDGAGILYASVTEKSAPELTIQIPDEVARVVTVDENFHQSAVNVTLPMAIGGKVDNPIALKGILIDKTQGIYLMSVGENRQFVSIRVGDTDIPIAEAAAAGYATYVGSPDQANYPGICYVQITDEALRKNDDGSYVQIGAQVVGLKLGTHTVEECRNGARFLYWLLKTSMTGSWGLGIADSEIDLDSFTEAIARVDAAGLKMDGVFYFRQPAQSWIDQICQAIRGTYEIGENGKRRLFVNANASSVKTYTKKNVKLLRKGKGSYVGRVFNKGRLHFDFNPLTGLFMQNVPYENSTSVGDIDEQLFEGQSYLIRDMATAQAILDYTCQKSQVGAAKVYFETTELPENPRTGQIITFDYPEKSLTGTWQITRIEIGKKVHKIEAEAFSSSIFISGTPGTAIDWAYDPPVVSPVQPGQASGLSLDPTFVTNPDGTANVGISGAFELPSGGYIGASVLWGEGDPPATWNDYGLIKNGQFQLNSLKPGTKYYVKVRMVSSTGRSDYITGSLTTNGDTEAPGAPSIGVTAHLKNIAISVTLASRPDDMAGFRIYRNIINDPLTAVSKATIESSKNSDKATVNLTADAYGQTYYFWATSYDKWGNESGFSTVAGPVFIVAAGAADLLDGALNRSELFQTGVVDSEAIGNAAVTAVKTALAAINNSTGGLNTDTVDTAQVKTTALKNPLGAVASWSAKNCTEASIAEAGGVRDVSGNGNHGQASGGTTIATGSRGHVFGFDGRSGSINIGNPASLQITGSLTMAIWVYNRDTATDGGGLFVKKSANGWQSSEYGLVRRFANSVSFVVSDGTANYMYTSANATQDAWEHFVGVYDATAHTVSIYRDGTLINTNPTSVGPLKTDGNLFIGGDWYSDGSNPFFKGFLTGPKIFNRALSSAEVKGLYMFPEDAIFGNVTADLLSTSQLITFSAQIAEAIINDAHITSLSAAKILTDYLAAARIEAGSLTGDKFAAKTITAREVLIGNPGAALNSDPNFQDASAWESKFNALTFTTVADGKAGNSVLRSPVNASCYPFSVEYLALDPSKTYRVRCWVRKSATCNGTLYVCWQTYDADDIKIPTFEGYYVVVNQTPGTVWTEFSALVGAGTSFPATANARTMRIGMLLNYGGYTGYMEAQDFRIEEVLPSTLIGDGTILSRHLTVEEAVITVGAQIANAVINSAHIDSLSAEKVTIGTFEQDRIPTLVPSKINGTALITGGAAADVNSGVTTINGGKITAESVEASKLTALARNLVNPVSQTGNVRGWGPYAEDGTGGPSMWLGYSSSEKAMTIYAIGNVCERSRTFLVDPNKIYRIQGQFKKSASAGIFYIGMSGFSAATDGYEGSSNGSGTLEFLPYNSQRAAQTATSNAYFDAGRVAPTSYEDFTFFLIGANRSVDECPNYNLSTNTPTQPYLKCNASGQFHAAIRILNWSNSSATTLYIKDLTVTEVGGGEIIADIVKGGVLESLNYSTTAGSQIDMNAGDMKLGGFDDPIFKFSNTDGMGSIGELDFIFTDISGITTTQLWHTSTGTRTNSGGGQYQLGPTEPNPVDNNGTYFALSHGKIKSDGTACLIPHMHMKTYRDNQTRKTFVQAQFADITTAGSAFTPFYHLARYSGEIAFYTNAGIYAGGLISGETVTDRTEMPETIEEAKEIINSMQPTGAKLDYKRFSDKGKTFAVKRVRSEITGKREAVIEEGRNLTKTVSALAMIVNKLEEQIIRLKMELADVRGDLTSEEKELIQMADNMDAETRELIAPHANEIMNKLKGER